MIAQEASVADEWAARLAQSWFLGTSGEDRLNVGGVSAGWAAQIEVYHLLRELAARRLGVPEPATDASVLARLKRRGWDRPLRLLVSRLAGIGAATRDHQAAALVLSEIPTPSMLDSLVAVAVALGPTGAHLSADPRALPTWRRAGFRPFGLWTDPRSTYEVLRRAANEFDDRWRAIERDPPAMRLGSQDLAQEVIPLLRNLLRRRTTWLSVEAAALQRCLEVVQPRCVVLASDQHRLGRVAVELARANGMKSLVVQHGLPQHPIGYVPVVADVVACWSSHAADWFAARGTHRSRLVVTGSPALEGEQACELPQDPMVLLLLSPTVSGLNERVTRIVLNAARTLRWPVTVKLHPGHRRWSAVLGVVAEHRGSVTVRVAHREALGPLIDEATVAVVHRSTTALQALARRRPVVVVTDPAAASFAELDAPMLQLPMASSSDQLAAALASLASPRSVDEYFEARAQQLEYVLGPRDSRSAVRIARIALDAGSLAD